MHVSMGVPVKDNFSVPESCITHTVKVALGRHGRKDVAKASWY